MLKNKTILIISPQSWGKMLLSKHHYAIELARYGNKVYFLNPPQKVKPQKISIRKNEHTANLFTIDHALFFPSILKFHLPGLFYFLMRFQVKRILRAIPEPVDIVWSFDLGNYYPFSYFPEKSFKIFHPVDEPLNAAAIEAAKGAQVIISVTREILEKYSRYQVPRHVINHGLPDEFVMSGSTGKKDHPHLQVGLSGNWLRPDIDTACLERIIRENPDVQFGFWGSYQLKQSNIGGDKVNDELIRFLQQAPNVQLHGPVSSRELARALHAMDAFLICYDVQKDQSKGTNYHKVMEYLSTGKVIVSNNITAYDQQPDLVQMVAERTHNNNLPDLFKKVIAEIDHYNAIGLIQKRRQYAYDNLYTKQVQRIEQLLPLPSSTAVKVRHEVLY